MTKLRYRAKKWRDLQPGDVAVLYSFKVPFHYVILGNPRKHAYVYDNIMYDARKAEDVVIEREVDAHPDEDVFVLDPAHHAAVVSTMTKEERWAEIHAEFEQNNLVGDADDENN
ncbi:TPA: hypothetical protein SMO99_003006 [Proteus mirabilis]|uniref:Uncharacterized protein n=2 Tax=Morganellaceae TaxID=1903414 RepID=A0AAI9HUE4_MORMO|nr:MULTISPECIES: hypothetical protein [Providencia]EJV1664325.1 hypothetical protein [Klebsiella pneumoniae]EKW8762779.1 hypothetical protein [Morganella morganii]THB20505.1 hypothetical protein E6R27_20530 [Providencia sp. MGF014]HEJ9424966.1 hypothetical protein [Proteus mirabilis]ELI9034670.1 hypothetical protein [Morganella morganii]